MVHETENLAAGIHLDANGDRVVGGSLRPDGTVRKTLKVRPGFVPEENIQRYNVRETVERRRRRRLMDGEKAKVPDQRPSSKFGVVNDILKVDPSGSKPSSRSNEELTTALSNLSIGGSSLVSNSESSTLQIKIQSPGTAKDITSSSAPSQSSPNPKPKTKKYTPPRLRKTKYTLADLDNA